MTYHVMAYKDGVLKYAETKTADFYEAIQGLSASINSPQKLIAEWNRMGKFPNRLKLRWVYRLA